MGLALSDIKQIKKVRNGLRIVGTGAAPYDDGAVVPPLCRKQWNLGQIQYLQDVGITHLVLNGDPQKIHILHRFLGLQAKEGDLLLSHNGVQIHPGGIDPLAPYILPAVKHVVEDLNSQVGHANLIYIGETHGKTYIHPGLVLHHRIYLTAYIPGRFLYLHQNII